MSHVNACARPSVSMASLGLTDREVKLLKAADANGDSVALGSELSDYRATTLRGPSQVLASEPFLNQQLNALERVDGAGVCLRRGHANRVIRSVPLGRRVSLEGFYNEAPAMAGIPGAQPLHASVSLTKPITVGTGARAQIFSTVFIVGATRQSAERGNQLPVQGDQVLARGALQIATTFNENGDEGTPYLRFSPGPSVAPFGMNRAAQEAVRLRASEVELGEPVGREGLMEIMMAQGLTEVSLERNDVHGTGRFAVVNQEGTEFFVKVNETGPNGEERLSSTYYGPFPMLVASAQ